MSQEQAARRIRHIFDAIQGSRTLEGAVGRALCRAEETENVINKVCTADEAVALIKDGSMVTMAGFVGNSSPDALLAALRRRYDETLSPKGLGLMFIACVGNSKGAGHDMLAVDGLVSNIIYAWLGSCPELGRMIRENRVTAHNLPLGVVSHLIRERAAGRAGVLTRTGMGTFVDPRETGGKRNARTTEGMVSRVSLEGEDYLWYKTPKSIDVALLRGTTADLDGNVSFEKEVLYVDQLNQAMAARNCGGIVIVQVERVVERHTIPARMVHLPGALVDWIVVAPPHQHVQSYAAPGVYDGSLCGEVRAPLHSLGRLPMNERKIMAHRAFFEINTPRSLVNLGVGVPEGVAILKASHGFQNPAIASATLTTEAGVFGGVPAGGLRFGSGHNPEALVPTATMIDLYAGGGVDVCVLGMAEADEGGNVNVHNFGVRAPGCGGFIDISQSAKKCVFTGTFTTGGLTVSIREGKLVILQEGRNRKFVKKVLEKTFAALPTDHRSILYITERAVFVPTKDRSTLELIEVAPGVDIERDILAHMDFKPVIRSVKLMDPRIFEA